MSHAKVTEEDKKLSSDIAYAFVNKTFTEAAQLLADAIRDARVKEAEWWNAKRQFWVVHYGFGKIAKERIEQLKRGQP